MKWSIIGIDVKLDSHDPVPREGDKIVTVHGKTYVVGNCRCRFLSKERRWPSGDRCGAHKLELDGSDTGSIIFSVDYGWRTNGTLYRTFSVITVEPVASLKQMNSDGRIACAACGGQIAEPFPGIRHCPVCEP